jgi:N-acetylglutamate synthase-like GNAT family acetyltransferase
LAHWLRNKAPEHFIGWIGQTSSSVLVAVENDENDKIRAVGLVSDAGEIRLNSVSPDARFRGISRSMVHALDRRARPAGQQALYTHEHWDSAALLSVKRLL